MSMLTPWTDGEIETIKEMWIARISSAQIAEKIGRTRRSVLGKIHRLGLTGKGGASQATNKARPLSLMPRKPKAISMPKPKLAYVQIADRNEYDATGLRISLIDLPAGACKWSVDYTTEHLFCGHKAIENKPYCAHHAERSMKREGVII